MGFQPACGPKGNPTGMNKCIAIVGRQQIILEKHNVLIAFFSLFKFSVPIGVAGRPVLLSFHSFISAELTTFGGPRSILP